MKPLSPDTTPHVQNKHYEMMRQLPCERRLAMAFELTNAARNLILADLKIDMVAEIKSEQVRPLFEALPTDLYMD